jgi:tetratricopeptide (TPR) repeat protein
MGWLWYLGMLVPVIGLVQVGLQARADRYTYLPLIGIFIMISWYLKEAARHIPARKIILSISASVLIITMIFLTRKQVGVWENDYTLFKHGAENSRLSYEKLCTYGRILADMGKTDEAIEQYLKAIEDNANFFYSHVNLAEAYQIKGEIDKAIGHYNKAIQIIPDNTDILNVLTYIHLSRGNIVDAMMSFEDSIRLDPFQGEFILRSASEFYRLGNIRMTLKCLELLLNIQPDNVSMLNSSGWVRAVNPDEKIRDPKKAMHFAKRACELTEYKDPDVLDTFSAAYAAAGKFEKAMETARKAIELARSNGNNDLADKIQTRLDLYSQGKTYLDQGLKLKNHGH